MTFVNVRRCKAEKTISSPLSSRTDMGGKVTKVDQNPNNNANDTTASPERQPSSRRSKTDDVDQLDDILNEPDEKPSILKKFNFSLKKDKTQDDEFPPLDSSVRISALHWSYNVKSTSNGSSEDDPTMGVLGNMKLPYDQVTQFQKSNNEPPPKPDLEFL